VVAPQLRASCARGCSWQVDQACHSRR
jgi:hypothetical protein